MLTEIHLKMWIGKLMKDVDDDVDDVGSQQDKQNFFSYATTQDLAKVEGHDDYH